MVSAYLKKLFSAAIIIAMASRMAAYLSGFSFGL